MEHELSPEQLERVREWLRQWQAHLRELGLHNLLEVMLDTPLGFISSHALLILEPVLNRTSSGELYRSLVHLLSTAEGTAWLRQQLADLNEKGIQR